MIKVEVRMNTDLIKSVGEYEPDMILKSVDAAYMQYAAKKELYEDGTVCYWGKGDRYDFGSFGSLTMRFRKTDWFIKYVDKWYWYNNDCMPYEDWFCQEDILEELGIRKSA